MTPERKVVVITGASRGIGAQLSKAYRHIGYITADGTRCRMNFISGDGDQGRISLPTEGLSELIMTLPRMVRQALRARHQDESLRLVYPAGKISSEQSSDTKTTS
jgi:NAD(P)-dependent dehydrogenase (short-subunit alcohol dehydrogenase family)